MQNQPSEIRLGMLTPSSNTVLEPLTSAMLADVPGVTAHFGRFRVLKISLDDDALSQFTNQPMLAAADLLADAKVQVICWNGTSSGWLGFQSDRDLCATIQDRTGALACSSVLALNEVLQITGAKRIAFVTPYLDEIQSAINAHYARKGSRSSPIVTWAIPATIPSPSIPRRRSWICAGPLPRKSPMRFLFSARISAAPRSPRSLRPKPASPSTTQCPPPCGSR